MTMSKQQYLRAMGVDVWILRPSPGVAPAVADSPGAAPAATRAAPGARAAPAPRPAPASRAAAPGTGASAAGLRFAVLHYGDIGLCVLLTGEAELPKRFCDDIARTLGADPKGLRYQQLDLPPPGAEGAGQDVAAAAQQLAQRFETLPDRVMVFGAETADFFSPLRDIEPMTPSRLGHRRILLISSLPALMRSSEAKRALLRVLHEWR